MMKRKTALKPTSFFWVAVNAIRQELNASPMRIVNGMASTASGDCGMPKRASTTRKMTARVPIRKADHASSPHTMLRIWSGVESIAS